MNVLNAALTTACLATLLLSTNHAQAQAPKPPTDARRVVHSAKNVEIKYEADTFGKLTLPKNVRDFDLVTSIPNPSSTDWYAAIDFRVIESQGAYALVWDSKGMVAVLGITGEGKLREGSREPSFSAAVKKDPGALNDIGLYVRGNQALVFFNKTYIDTFDVGAVNDFGELYIGLQSKEAGSVKIKALTVKVPPNAIPPAAAVPKPTPVAGKNIVIKSYSFGYEQHGRPAGMDNPEAGCGMFDDSHPVRSFQIRLNVRNNGKQAMKPNEYYAFAVKPNGKAAYTCYYITSAGGLPEIPPNDSRDITFQAFVEANEAVAYVVVEDKKLGQSNRIPIP